jgi:condensin complex subunit 3
MDRVQDTSNLQRMQLAFNRVQTGSYTDVLKDMVHALSTRNVFEEFCCVLNTILTCKRAVIPAKIVIFLKRIFEDLSETPGGSQFILGVFVYLTRLTESRLTKVRKNSLLILKLVIDIPKTKVVITPEFLSKVCERLFDKEKSVRKEALRVLANHQDVQLNSKIKVINLFKDIVRHDPNHEVRGLALHVIAVETSTYNCIIERCMDISDGIRKLFFMEQLPRINLKVLSCDRRIFLMEKAMLEREFDARKCFVEAVLSTYSIPGDIQELVNAFYDRTSLGHLEAVLHEVFIREGCEMTFAYLTGTPTEENTFLARVALSYIEESSGRDSLNLPELEIFVEAVYEACLSAMQADGDEERQGRIAMIKNLFVILRFYDFFSDDARKFILSTVYKLLVKSPVEEVVEESVQLLKLVCESDLNALLGGIISKTAGTDQGLTLTVCKQIMKHIRPFGELHQAIINEIVLPNMESSEMKAGLLEIGFYYLLESCSDTVAAWLRTSMREDPRILGMCVDLAISKADAPMLEEIVEYLEAEMLNRNEEVIVPASKLVLCNTALKAGFKTGFIDCALRIYYGTANNHLQQYLTVMFYELFSSDSAPLIAVFCSVLEELSNAHRIFIDQALYWIANSVRPNGSQELFYNICIYLFNNYENTANKKLLLGVLDKIEVLGCWDLRTLKKILFCCSLLTRKAGGRHGLGEVIGRLMAVDDGEPISQEDLGDVKRDLNTR